MGISQITSAAITPGTVTPTNLSTGAPSWDTTGNTAITGNVTVTGNVYQNGLLTPTLVQMLTYNLAF